MSPKIQRIRALGMIGIGTLIVGGLLAAADSLRPTKSEVRAMERRLWEMKESAASPEVVVYPVRLGDEWSGENAAHLAELIGEGLGWQVEVSDKPLVLEVAPNRNEQKVLWEFAHAFRAHLQESPPPTDYALLADYHLSPRDGRVMAVHFAVCDQTGEWVIVDMQNTHHADFKRISPASARDCDRLVASRLKGYWDE